MGLARPSRCEASSRRVSVVSKSPNMRAPIVVAALPAAIADARHYGYAIRIKWDLIAAVHVDARFGCVNT
jgi:hypothetical protein